MSKVYAKNPAELIIDNPAPKTRTSKDPRRVAAGKKAWATRTKTKTRTNMSTKTNPEKIADTGKEMFLRYGLAAVGTIASVKGVSFLMNRFGGSLPAAVRRVAPIVVPAIAGVAIGAKSKKNNEIAQGVAGGMVYASVSQALHTFLPTAVTDGLSDGLGYKINSFLADALEPGSLIVTPSGEILDLNGNPQGTAQAALPAPVVNQDVFANPPAAEVLADVYGNDWEQDGEQYGL